MQGAVNKRELITRERVLAAIAITLLVVVIVRAVLAMQPPESMTSFANRMQAAIDQGDSALLYNSLVPQDQEAIARGDFERLLEWRNASFKGFVAKGTLDRDMNSVGYGLRRVRKFKRADGVEFEELMEFERGPEGPLISCFWLLEGAFKARYMPIHAKDPVMLKIPLCYRDALKNHYQELRSFSPQILAFRQMMTWEDLRVIYESMVWERTIAWKDPNAPRVSDEERTSKRESLRAQIRAGQI